MNNVISQSLGLDPVNINVYANVYQNIPLSSRDRAIFTFSEFGNINALRIQNFIKIFQTVKELSTFFTNRPGTKSSQTVR